MVPNHVLRPRAQVPDLPSFIPFVPTLDGEDTFDAAKEGQSFLSRFADIVERQDWDALAELFCDNGFWKDNLTLTFDKRTLQGKKAIAEAWRTLSATRKPVIHTTKEEYALGLDIAFTRLAPSLASLDVPFCFSTDAPRMNCVGLAKLVPQDGTWKVWIMTTVGCSLQERPFNKLPRQSPSLVSESQRGKSRAQGLPDVKGVFDAVVVGASTSGVAMAINLESIGANVIALELRDEAAGNWSEGGKAYVTLHHTPRMMELPQHPLPKEFSKDLGGQSITRYVSNAVEALKLPVFCGIRVISNTYDEAVGLWDILIEDVTTKQQSTLQSKNVILALGPIASEVNPYIPPLSDREQFKGSVVHSTKYKDAQPYQGKNVLVIGASNSAHDIARNLAEGGARDITLLQRGPTAFFEWEKISPMVEGPFLTPLDLDTADLLFTMMMPLGVARDFARGAFGAIEATQTEFYATLESKGYSIERNRCFVSRVYDSRNGHFFMDRQKSLEFVFNDRIKVARGEARGFVPEGVVVHDPAKGEDKVLKADAVVLATGFETIDLPQIWADTEFIDPKSASLLENPCAMELDREGEMIAQCTDSGHRHLYFASHNVVTVRLASKFVAIQIMADLMGRFPARYDRA
ncbi:hypothetical protein BX600DRAFT_453401 [Xylariales sp. PMI_506]|nr:hypothetical protein BX600DRAFT_453401 [Xylariales sp. PMI_506]